tara:strand:+ start:177 stop:776 length:600 start_codon:yes stop_codon:yes gene_type:complete
MLKTQFSNYDYEAGVDEAGRGSLAGPVTASAVILPKGYTNKQLNDSKKISPTRREVLRKEIEKNAIAYSVINISAKIIDKRNILNATFMAMNSAIKKLNVAPQFIIVDGNRFRNYLDIPSKCIVKGDQKYLNIAAASILAKTYRDKFMKNLHIDNPRYKWEKNKGYGTPEHRESIIKYGRTKFHRKTYKLKEEQLKLNL